MEIKNFDNYKDKGLTGLANLGNTCFMNSTIQCISHTYELNNILKSGEYKKNLNKKPETLILLEWDKLRELMWSENCVISPGGFLGIIQKIAKIKDKQIFTGFAQNDLPEFLLFLIDGFHNSINRGVEMKINGKVENDIDKLAKMCYEMQCNMFKNDYSEIIKLFYGCHVSRILDCSDNLISQTPEPFFLINLPIPNKKNINLMDCFDLYTDYEVMDGENQWYNEKEEKHQDIKKNILFFSLPHILVIDFKRFNNNMKKNNALIDFPLENLDLSKYVIGYNKDEYKYDLYGICNHSGNVMGGHYTAFVKNANNKWYNFNDTKITEMRENKNVVTNQAYCLFYRKK